MNFYEKLHKLLSIIFTLNRYNPSLIFYLIFKVILDLVNFIAFEIEF